MILITRDEYDLLLSVDPCEIFNHYNVDEMHGLSLKDCRAHPNNRNTSYISGWCNYIPNSDRMFVYINLTRCNSEVDLICNLNHELMHWSLARYGWDINFEEEIITCAELETREVFELTKLLIL